MSYAAWARRELHSSLWILFVLVAVAVVGLATEADWSMILRVVVAFIGYVSVLLVLERTRLRADRRVPYWWFGAAGAVAGFLSGIVRPQPTLDVVFVQLLGVALLLGGIHWLALRRLLEAHLRGES